MKRLTTPKLTVGAEVVNSAVMSMALEGAHRSIVHQVQSMVLYREDLYYDTEQTPFERLFKRDDFGKGKDKVSSIMMVTHAVAKCTTAYVQDQLFTEDEKRRLPNNAFDHPTEIKQEHCSENGYKVRLLKSKDGFDVTIPMANIGMYPDTLASRVNSVGGRNLRDPQEMESRATNLVRLFGEDFFNLERPVDAQFKPKDVLVFERQNFKWPAELPLDDEFKDLLVKDIKSIRVMAAAVPKSECPVLTLPGDEDGTPITLLSQVRRAPEQRVQYMNRAIETRFREMSCAIVLHIPAAMAQSIAQIPWKEIKSQYVASWVRTLVDAQYSRKWDAPDFMTPLASIREFNKTSRYQGKKKTNESGLTITRKGDIVFIPEVDQIDYVEAQIEEEGAAPNGEWTLIDMMTPEQGNFITKMGNDGIERSYRKTRGGSRIVYTDWKNSKFAYTDMGGQLKVVNLSSCRPVDATHLVRYTERGMLHEERISNVLLHAHRLGVQAYSLPTEEEFLSVFPARGENSAREQVGAAAQGKFKSVILAIIDAIHDMYQGTSPVRTDNAMRLYLEDNYKPGAGLRVAEIHENSTVPALRFIGRTMKKMFDYGMQDLDRFCQGRGVMTALNDLGFAAVINAYGGKGNKVRDDDAELRKKYTSPDLVPPQQLSLDDIPFVKDLKVQPHQVKCWNYLKNQPQCAVLDVAAGGGKTILALLDVAKFIGTGGRLPLIMMPNNLLKNYVNDANLVFKGRMNVVCINGETMKSWGPERLQKLIDAAPVNTVFLTSYDFFMAGKDNASYGTVGMEVSTNADFMCQFDWGGVWMDESHKIKNESAQTTKAILSMVADIPFKRQLTGTYMPDTYTDAVAQFAAMNPSVFGDREQFEDTYLLKNKGRGAWIPNAGRIIRKRMSEYANIVTIKRREWRALLPDPKESFYAVNLTAGQRKVYESILKETLVKIEEMIRTDKKLRDLMNEQEGNDEVQEALAAILDPCLQRLERFLTSPDKDDSAALLVNDEDKVSAKLTKAYDLCRKHINEGIPGKILIFTQYKDTALSFYEHAPADLKDLIIHYTAEEKVSCMQEFESAADKLIMCGVETSMNTGLNLQFCSRLIRMETVWNWGNLEQGEARVYRPNLKIEEFRETIFFDWVFADRTIDVTKTARMISKLISVAKFYEPEDARFQRLGVGPDGKDKLKLIPMTLDTIAQCNSYEDPLAGLTDHFQAYQDYRSAETASFEEFKADPRNRIEPYKIVDNGIPTNLGPVGMIAQVPYIADMELYGMDKLNLIKYASYMNEHAPPGMKDAVNNLNPTGLAIHTEDGDGVCEGPGVKNGMQTGSIWVRLNTGEKRSYPKSNVFVIAKKFTNAKSIREAMGKLAGADIEKPTAPVRVPLGDQGGPAKTIKVKPASGKPSANEQVQAPAEQRRVKLSLVGYNEMLCICIDEDDSPEMKAEDLTRLGFVPIRQYYYAEVKRWQQLEAWIEMAEDKFTIESKFLGGIKHLLEVWKKSRNNIHLMQQLNAAKLRDFFRAKNQPVDKGEIKPYIMVQDEEVFLCMDKAANQSMIAKVRAMRVPGVVWDGMENGEHYKFLRSKAEVQKAAADLEALGYRIVNKGSFSQQFNDVRIIAQK